MSEFRIFCIGAVFGHIFGTFLKLMGAEIDISAGYLVMTIGGVAAVSLWGRKS